MEATNKVVCQNIVLTLKGLKEEFIDGVKEFWWGSLALQRLLNEWNSIFHWPEDDLKTPKVIWLTRVTKTTTVTVRTLPYYYKRGEAVPLIRSIGIGGSYRHLLSMEIEIVTFRVIGISETVYTLDPTPYKRKVTLTDPINFSQENFFGGITTKNFQDPWKCSKSSGEINWHITNKVASLFVGELYKGTGLL